jgi:hypothetical protein
MPDRPGSVPDTNLVALLLDVRADVRGGFSTVHERLDRLDNKIDAHAHDDQHMISVVRGEIADVRDEHTKTARDLAKIQGERTVEARVEEASFFNGGTNGTGRHRLVNEHGDSFVIPTPPAGVPMSLHIGKSQSTKPPAIVKIFSKAFESTAGKLIGGALMAAVAAVGGGFFHAAVTPTETKIVQIPVTAPPVMIAPPVEILPAAAFVQVPDAGAPKRR